MRERAEPDMKTNDEQHILLEYENRDLKMPWNDWKRNIYHPRNPMGYLFTEHNHLIIIEALNLLNLDLHSQKILDVGCGYGAWLRFLVELGALPGNCVGVDISSQRILIASEKNPAINYQKESLSKLEFDDANFDLIFQTVVFSSIMDSALREDIAQRMKNVLRPGGYIFWVDLQKTISDKLTGFSEADVQLLFPDMKVVYKRQVHPRYFRRINGKHAWLSRIIYQFTNFGCESLLIVLQKDD